MAIQADLLILILGSIISLTLQSPCKISVQCSCNSTGNTIESICVKEDIVDERCSRWPGCLVCQRGKECQKCPGIPTCTEATTHEGKFRQKRQNYMRPGYPENSTSQESPPNLSSAVSCWNPFSFFPNGRVVYLPAATEGKSGPLPIPDEEELPEGATLQFACDEGFTINGAETLTCDNIGFWSDIPPSCDSKIPAPNLSSSVYCPNPFLSFPNGRIVYLSAPTEGKSGPLPIPDEEELPEGARLQYACDEGFTIIGFETLTCVNNGFWSDIPPSCDSNIFAFRRIKLTLEEKSSSNKQVEEAVKSIRITL